MEFFKFYMVFFSLAFLIISQHFACFENEKTIWNFRSSKASSLNLHFYNQNIEKINSKYKSESQNFKDPDIAKL